MAVWRIGLDSVSMAEMVLRGRKCILSWHAAMMPGEVGFSRSVRPMVRSADLDPGIRGRSHLGECVLVEPAKPGTEGGLLPFLHVHHVAFYLTTSATFSALVACSEQACV